MPFATKSLSLNGTTKYVNLGDAIDFDTADTRTVVIWFKTAATSGYLVSKRGGSTAFLGWGLFVDGSGQLGIQMCNDAATSAQIDVNTTSTWNDGAWHCAAFTWDGNATPGAAGLKLYVEAVQQVLNVGLDGLGANPVSNSSDFNFGGRTSGSTLLAGNVAQATIYDRVLTKSELEDIYNGGNPVDPKLLSMHDALLAYVPLGEGDTYPTALERALDPVVPMAAGKKSTYSKLPNDTVPVEWCRGVGFPDMAPFYPGPGGAFSPFSTRFQPATTLYRAGPVNQREIDEAWSISFWVRYDDTSLAYREFVTHAVDNDRDGNYIVRPHVSAPGQIGVLMRGGNFVGFVEVYTTASTFNDGNWHHVCATYNGNLQSTGVHIWVDSVDEPLTTVQNSTLLSLLNGSFNIGGYNDNPNPISGEMAQVSMYDSVLDAAAVAAIYNGAVPVDLSGLGSAADLLSWWPLGSEEGDQDRPGTLVSMDSSNVSTTAPGGVLTRSFQFNGTDETISFDDAFNFENDQPFSFVIWFNTSYSGGVQTLVSKFDSSFRGYGAEMDSAGVLYLEIASSLTNRIQVYTTSSGHNDGAWHSLECTYSGSRAASGAKIYIDGVLQTMTTGFDTLTTTIVDTADFRIGSRSTNVQFWDGYLTGLVIFATELIGADCVAIHNGGTPVDPSTLGKAPYMVAYWPLGAGYFPGVMVGMSGADIQDDAPYVSTLTTEKTWVTTANYDLGAGQNTEGFGKLLLLDWKNKLAANGWMVIGSGNSVTYEWMGATAGPYDVWSTVADVVFRDSDSGLGPLSWVTLQSPVTSEGQFWLTIAWYASTQEEVRVWVGNSVPTLPGDPLNAYPIASSDEWFWLLNDAQFFNFYSATEEVRTYFSVCAADGSFVFGRQTLNETDWNACQMFHVLAADEYLLGDFPMRACAYGYYWATVWSPAHMAQWHAHIPGTPGDSLVGVVLSLVGIVTREVNETTADAVGGASMVRPCVLVGRGVISSPGGLQTILGRVQDVYLSNTSTARGSMAPYEAPHLFTNMEGYFWIPGDTEPSFV